MALAVVVVLGLVTAAAAQEEAPPKRAPAKKPAAAAPVDVEKLLEATRIKADFAETPLKEVYSYLSDVLNVDILLDKTSLSELGVDGESPVTLQISKSEVSVRTILELSLRQIHPSLVATPKDGLLLITSEEHSYVTASYSIADLFPAARDSQNGIPPEDSAQLVELIMGQVSPSSWGIGGGPASLNIFRETMVVKNSPQAQRQIRDLLASLREAKPAAK